MLQALQHWWSGGTFPGYAKTRVKYYVDGEDTNSTALNLPLGLAHGQDDVTQDNGQVRHLLPYPRLFPFYLLEDAGCVLLSRAPLLGPWYSR